MGSRIKRRHQVDPNNTNDTSPSPSKPRPKSTALTSPFFLPPEHPVHQAHREGQAEASSAQLDQPQPVTPSIPASIGRFFKTTAKARKLMDPTSRICELDIENGDNVLVYSAHPQYSPDEWTQLKWSQCSLWRNAQDDPTMRVSRKAPGADVAVGDVFKVFENDFSNEVDEDVAMKDQAIDEVPLTRNRLVTMTALGFEQIKMPWIYLISEKQAPDHPTSPGAELFPSPQQKLTKVELGSLTDGTAEINEPGFDTIEGHEAIDNEYVELENNHATPSQTKTPVTTITRLGGEGDEGDADYSLQFIMEITDPEKRNQKKMKHDSLASQFSSLAVRGKNDAESKLEAQRQIDERWERDHPKDMVESQYWQDGVNLYARQPSDDSELMPDSPDYPRQNVMH